MHIEPVTPHGASVRLEPMRPSHAFETLGANRVELKTDALNEKSRAAIVRIGAQQEGIFSTPQTKAPPLNE